MIHRIYVTEESSFAELKKLFRKKLMTGGAVFRLDPALSPESLSQIVDQFYPHAVPNNVAAMVLREVAKHPHVSEKILEQLEALSIAVISGEIATRGAISTREIEEG